MTNRAKARRARQIQKAYAGLDDSELRAMFDRIGTNPDHRVKRTGHIKLFWAKQGDDILNELRRRNREAAEAALNDFNYVGSRHHY